MNVARIVEGHPDGAAALVAGGVSTTYGQLRARAGALRGGLAGLGVVAGDRVALVAGNEPRFVEAYLAVVGLGAIAVPLNPASPRAELEREIVAVGARFVVVGERVDPAVIPPVDHVLGPADVDGLASADPVPVVDVPPGAVAVLIFTAGTAGAPKAAMLTHGNLRSNLEQVQQLADRALTPDDRSLGQLPLFHIFVLNVVLGLSLASGAAVVLLDRFDPVTALETVRAERCTVVAGAPPMWAAWAALPDAPPDAFASVRLATSGASPLPKEVARTFVARFGLELSEGYGLTEASPVVTSSVGRARPGSIGRPLPGVELRLVDGDGDDALLGDSGEIWVRGPNVFAGYWEDAEATAAALTPDGWLRTGDIAVADDDGDLSIVDRSKDLIIVSGFNVYPAEVEQVLLEHPAVGAAAVVGDEDAASGETVHAFVVPEPGAAVVASDLIAFCATRLARYKCPTAVTVVDTIPTGLAGKVLRRELRAGSA